MISFFSNEFVLFIYFVFLFYLIKKNLYFFIVFFYLFFEQIKNILSNYYLNINASVFMREVEKYSSNDFSLVLLIFLYITFFISLILIYKFIFQHKFTKIKEKFIYKEPSVFYAKFFIYLTLIIELILIIHILSLNTPLFHDNINKNNYWTDYALFPKIKFLSSQLSLLLFIIGFFYTKQTLFNSSKYTNKFIYFIILFLSIFYYTLMKQKFGGPLLMLFSFFFSYLVLGLFYKIIDTKKIFIYSIFIISILSITVYLYFFMRFSNDAIKMILERVFNLQSEIWEVTYQYLIHNKLPFDDKEFFNELSTLFGFNNYYTGMQYVMSKVMEEKYFNFFIDIHINLSSAYPSYLFYVFPSWNISLPLIVITNFFLYSFYVYLGFKIVEKLLLNKVLVAGMYLKLLFSVDAIISQVYLEYFINFKTILFILVILLLESNFFKKYKKVKYENTIYKWNK